MPIVTLDDEHDHRQIEVELWYGVLVNLEVVDEMPAGSECQAGE